MASKKVPSFLSKTDPESLLGLPDQCIVSELKERAPFLHRVFQSAVMTKRRKMRLLNGQYEDTSIPAISMATSALLKKRCSYLSAQAFRIGFVLHHNGAKEMVCKHTMKTGCNIIV